MMKIMFMMLIMMSIIITLTTNNFLMIWIMMELNLLLFIPMLINKMNIKWNSLTLMKYFLIQIIASMMFLFSMLFMMIFNMIFFFYMILMSSMLMKLGMPPFHYWYKNLMNKINWNLCFMLSSIQKIIPFYIMMKLITLNYFMIMIILSSSIYTIIKGQIQYLIKSIMVFSSINHSSWILMILMINQFYAIKYLFIYIMLNFKIMNIFKKINFIKINNLYNLNINLINKILILSLILSLGGLPPFFGFIMKWYMLSYLIKFNKTFLFILLMLYINASFTLMYYMNLFIPSMFNNSFKNKLKNNNNLNYFLYLILPTSFYMLLLNKLF